MFEKPHSTACMKFDAKSKKLMLFFGGLTLFVILLAIGVNFLLKLVPVPAPVPPPSPPALGSDETKASEESGGVFHIQAGTVDHRPIRYTQEGFSPRSITIQASDDLGCLITVVNQSDAPLRVGVGPHDPAGDPGANYGEIQSGKAGIIDARYADLEGITLHNHARPEHEFSVIYGPGCK